MPGPPKLACVRYSVLGLFSSLVPTLSILSSPSGNANAVSSEALSPNTWYYLSATFDGTTATLYIDGTAVGSTIRVPDTDNRPFTVIGVLPPEISIPMADSALRSLNLSTSVAVAAYEVRRQWAARA